jgi:hypothetical protein
MKMGLRVSFLDGLDDYSSDRRFRFAVVDLDKADYPLNFVCMLPIHVKSEGDAVSNFARVFGDESLAVAKGLLLGALENETASDVKVEIERRLRLLEPKQAIQVKCSGCGRLFQPRRVRRFQHNFCDECLKKRYGSRA